MSAHRLAWMVLLVVAGCVVDERTPPALANGQSVEVGKLRDAMVDATSRECDVTVASASCDRDHALGACYDGTCQIVACDDSYADCNGSAEDGCEARLDSPDHCGLCVAKCQLSHASASCHEGRCDLAGCDDGFGDCDGDSSNGCERSLNTVQDCGHCGVSCKAPAHGSPQCHDGMCEVGSCDPGFGNCNGAAGDGCEEALETPERCGDCDGRCELANTSDVACTNHSCAVTRCSAGFDDCNGRADDGCEIDLHSPDHCGACTKVCVLPHVGRALCDASNDCGIDRNCPNGSDCPSATNRRGCDDNFADCDGSDANGCETDLRRLSDCGACGHSCVAPGTTSECRNGLCNVTGCADGYLRCGDSCLDVRKDPKNCGACGAVCQSSAPNCAGGVCTAATCDATHADCNKGNTNCDFDLTSAGNCGACGHRCADPAHANAACKGGTCGIGTCASGWADCDGDPSNGCEVDVTSINDCGKCKVACAIAHGSARCDQGQCQVDKCDVGFENCNGAAVDGCETDLSLPANCSSCGTSCVNLPNAASSSCGKAGCEIVCQAGRANCNGQAADGCEANLSDASSCGSCATNCSRLPNVTGATCFEGMCRIQTCRSGFADCDGSTANGCEAQLNSINHCAACDKSCVLAHGTSDCSTGSCALSTCDPGFDNCDGNAANGCEASLASPDHCGGCTNACPSGAPCINGSCGCANDAGCPSGQKCCSGQCSDTSGACFPWPCIAGTDNSSHRNNCGGCGMACVTWCCSNVDDGGTKNP